jgi:hypothetical protein
MFIAFVHLAEDCLNQNHDLHELGCFQFENFFCRLRKLVRCSNLPLEQLIKRVQEMDYGIFGNKSIYEEDAKVTPFYKKSIISKFIYNKTCIDLGNPNDSFVITTNKKVMKITNIIQIFTSL